MRGSFRRLENDFVVLRKDEARQCHRMDRNGLTGIMAGSISRSCTHTNWIGFYDSVNYLHQEHYAGYSGACVTAKPVMLRLNFDKFGPFDEAFHEVACEDWEGAGRTRQRGIPIMFRPVGCGRSPVLTLRNSD